MATIANLAVSLTARIGNFEKGFNKAKKITMRFGSDLAMHTKTIAKYGAALVSVAAGAIAYFTKQQLEATDQSAKMARTLTMTNSELAAAERVASLAGVGNEQLHKSLLRMNATISGGGSTMEKLAMLSDQYSKLTSAGEKATLIQKTFGRGAMNIGNILEGGAKQFAQAEAEARKFGLSVSEVDSNKIEYANDRMTDLTSLIQGAAKQIGVNLAPFISHAAEKLIGMGTAGEGMGEKVTNAFNYVLKVVARLADYFELVKAGVYGFQAAVQASAGAILSAINMIGSGWVDLVNLIFRTNIKFTSMFDDMAKDFAESAAESATKAAGAIGNFMSGVNSKKAEVFFEGIKAKAQEVAESTANIGQDVQDMVDVASGKTASFQQIDLKRVAIGGVSANPADKGVNRKQGDTMIQRLAEIARNTASPGMLIT
jgi:hypothetical protein